MSKTVFVNSPKNQIIRTSWGAHPVFFWMVFYVCLISVGLILFPPLHITGIRLAVLIAAVSVLLALHTAVVDSVAGLIIKRFFDKPEIVENLSPLAHHYVLSNTRRNGYIYLVKRFSDGVYKIGKTRYFHKRFKQLSLEYGPIYAVAVWEVPNYEVAERVALKATLKYWQPDRRKELREMNETQALNFIRKFSKYVESLDVPADLPKEQNGTQT